MEIFRPVGKKKSKKTEITELCLQSIRFRKLLENARAIHYLFEDGNEKMGGDYIFDRRFVASLVDRVLDRIGLIVFDASVLAPDCGVTLSKLYDAHKEIARQLVLGADSPRSGGESAILDTDLRKEPEYRLLANVLSWMSSPGEPDHLTVMDFIKTVFDRVISDLDEKTKPDAASFYPLRLRVAGMENLIGIIDVRGGLGTTEDQWLSSHDLNCRPLGLMLAEVERRVSGEAPVSRGTDVKWLAAVSDEHLSLRSADTPGQVRLETMLSGYKKSDYIFLFVKKTVNPEKFVSQGFRIEKTDSGALCWSDNMPQGKIENDLIHLGCLLFGATEL